MSDNPPGEFCNTCDEVHAVWYGFVDAISLWKAGTPYAPEAMAEPHYYLFGQAIGKTVLIGIPFLMGVAYAL